MCLYGEEVPQSYNSKLSFDLEKNDDLYTYTNIRYENNIIRMKGTSNWCTVVGNGSARVDSISQQIPLGTMAWSGWGAWSEAYPGMELSPVPMGRFDVPGHMWMASLRENTEESDVPHSSAWTDTSITCRQPTY